MNILCGTSKYASHHLFVLIFFSFGIHGVLRSFDAITGIMKFKTFVVNVSTICLTLIVELANINLSEYLIGSSEKRIIFYNRQELIRRNTYVSKKVAALPVLRYKCAGPFFEVRKGFFLKYIQKCLEFMVLLLTYF